tara:strand:+ start:1776 stop:2105 length:330 start_codon:yes stop_codon:yes gene_type:complete
MSENNLKVWLNCIERCQLVYAAYSADQSYLCANRIFSANLRLYELTELLYNNEGFGDLIHLLMHLDDWFLQFEELKLTKPLSTSHFAFERVNGSVPYPKEIINQIINKL